MGDDLYFHLKNFDNDKHSIMTVRLSHLCNCSSAYSLVTADGVDFRNNKMYVYRVENNTLTRWTITPDGEEINPLVMVNSTFVCFCFLYINKYAV